ncbi:hypothetical protein [Streptomyces sp. NPDC097610]|uniref:hypothetical protein n=1 Tax=Streptomyces sp. NPDC097610 TaxID=3157227 RepID=UPI00331F4A04
MDMLNGLASDDLTRSTQALLSLTYHDPDRFWLEDLLLREVDEANDPALRALAVTCMGHLGRMRGEVSNRIIEFLEGHLGDAVLGGIAEDALGDIRDFAVVVDPPTA